MPYFCVLANEFIEKYYPRKQNNLLAKRIGKRILNIHVQHNIEIEAFFLIRNKRRQDFVEIVKTSFWNQANFFLGRTFEN